MRRSEAATKMMEQHSSGQSAIVRSTHCPLLRPTSLGSCSFVVSWLHLEKAVGGVLMTDSNKHWITTVDPLSWFHNSDNTTLYQRLRVLLMSFRCMYLVDFDERSCKNDSAWSLVSYCSRD